MAVLMLTGHDLTLADLVAAARTPGPIRIAPAAIERMRVNRAFAERVAERGDAVYGLTTGVGVRKKTRIDRDRVRAFNRRMLREHATGLGPGLPPDVVRAGAILLLHQLSAGRAGVRPELVVHLADRLSTETPIHVPTFGSTGIGDVVPLAHLVSALLDGAPLEAGEALPLIGQGSVTTAQAALAFHDTTRLLETLLTLAVLDLEAFAANPSPYHPAAGAVRPYPGYRRALEAIGYLLRGSRLHDDPRHLQTATSFRDVAVVHGAADDAFAFAGGQIAIELNAHQQNPLALEAEDRMLPVASFDLQALAAALDLVRIALAPCLTSQTERSIKLLQASQTGLGDGLEPPGDETGHGLSEMAWTLQAIGSEARLLIQPVSAEIPSAMQAEGIEDRMTNAGLGARRLAEMVSLGFHQAAIGAVIACQAIDRRGCDRLGPNLAPFHAAVRHHVAALAPGDPPPPDLAPLTAALRGGLLTTRQAT